MTRINVVRVETLCDKHLVAEWKEIWRVFNHRLDEKYKGEYRLGQGHVLWARNYLIFIAQRCFEPNADFLDIIREKDSIIRTSSYYTVKTRDILTNNFRLIERMPNNPKWTNREVPNYMKKGV